MCAARSNVIAMTAACMCSVRFSLCSSVHNHFDGQACILRAASMTGTSVGSDAQPLAMAMLMLDTCYGVTTVFGLDPVGGGGEKGKDLISGVDCQ